MQADIAAIKQQFTDVTSRYDTAQKEICILKKDNADIGTEIDYLHAIINKQATQIANLDREIDDINQYGRRENVVFTNLKVDRNNCKDQVIELCQELGVDVDTQDIVDAHPLPIKKGKPSRVIVRFHERSNAKKVFLKRKESKNIDPGKKSKLAINSARGFAIQPNLTAKRAKLFAQVQQFNDVYKCAGTWVDFNTGKIYLKIRDGERGHHISDTGCLLDIKSEFKPVFWYFCAPPLFDNVQ
ncbi:MAG: hypothetical protein HRU38_25390 [Saccharospirillaceae bacterium]|nr:hypothetical protein [Saccharospirillaceae bacterium]